jgi:hypothetical protein
MPRRLPPLHSLLVTFPTITPVGCCIENLIHFPLYLVTGLKRRSKARHVLLWTGWSDCKLNLLGEIAVGSTDLRFANA